SDALDVDSCEPRVPRGHERPPLMICRYCIRYALGQCLKEHPTLQGPLSLQLSDGRRFPLHFDCRECQMHVLPPAGQVFSPEF
ncbi:MAG: hypothetical protein K6C30_08060, partial [Bacteroidaceae bacterium]|nr:hypothetical protein [Bacteroidaceae bacterium]